MTEEWALDERIRVSCSPLTPIARLIFQDITCPILLTDSTDDELINERHIYTLTSILQEGGNASKTSTKKIAGHGQFTITRSPW